MSFLLKSKTVDTELDELFKKAVCLTETNPFFLISLLSLNLLIDDITVFQSSPNPFNLLVHQQSSTMALVEL